ncbi:Gfo/Idh/MocA family oxidoreductase, partial [Candidatus Sumerlaeota bacterium]|nr:Gfo/Idh/MocA family oxidoreductase [Candidatus Sumerlaeota bacterium]
EMAVAACAADKNIYCEKPFGLCAKDADAIYKAASNLKKAFQVGFQWVYNQNFRAAIEAVHAGLIGDVRFIHAQRHGGDLPHKKSWLFDRDRSGDIIVEQAVHEMNIICWGLKSHPERACGLGGTNVYINDPPGRKIMDHYSVTYEFPGPVRVSYSHLYYAHPALAKTHIWFFGTKGAVDVMEGQIYLNEGQAPAPKAMNLTGEDTYNALVSFFNDVRTGGKPAASAEKGLIATKMSVLGRTAIQKEKVVSWKQIK